ncbi:MAG: 5-(carboxyamino)imidazole ribonucleotide synthase [Trueperaceae bacterium]|nr:5-(carboxyamino)imidazole ribonucleotide synthase [Trueperaceae bacterium]
MTTGHPAPVLPGATIGVLGGGQLGRMLAIAARRLGYGVWVWSPDASSPAFAVADRALCAPYDDHDAFEAIAAGVAVVALEFENLPVATLERLDERVPVRPGPALLALTSHRLREKRFLERIGVRIAPFESVTAEGELDEALRRLGAPAVLKTVEFGYDGKGQVRIDGPADHDAAHALLRTGACVLERHVDLALEISVVVARALDDTVVVYPPFENAHAAHVLDVSVVPARVSPGIAAEAVAIATRVAHALDLVGLACVELFVTRAGELLVNEIAPRPHNSAHVTLEAVETDQFEQQLRAVCGLPLGGVGLRSPGAMANLLGDLWEGGTPDWARALSEPGVHLHLYGKAEARTGRKMGHLSVLDVDPDGAERRVRSARGALTRARREA